MKLLLNSHFIKPLLAVLILFTLNSCQVKSGSEKTTDPSSVQWHIIETKDSLSPRHECGFVEANGKFYLLGGRGIKPINIYDPQTNQWTDGAKPPMEIHHFQPVAYEGRIYAIGAMTGKYPRETPVPNVLIYDPGKDEWIMGDEIPEERRRGSAGVVVHGSKAIIISGITDGHWDGHVPWVDAYDFETGIWTRLSDAPRARDHFHAAINNAKIYCAGGRNSSAKTKQTFELTIPEVDVYDIKTNSWASLPADQNLPTERAGTSATFYDDQLLIIGGESATQKKAHSEVEAYHPYTQSWIKLDSLNVGRHGTQVVNFQNALYTASGSGKRGGRPELPSLEKFMIKK